MHSSNAVAAVVVVCLLSLCSRPPAAQAKLVSKSSQNAKDGETVTITCKEGELIHIDEATWSGFSDQCRARYSRVRLVKKRCENKETCVFIPSRDRNDGLYLDLKGVCRTKGESLRAKWECHNPCLDLDCGDGTCSPLTWETHKCVCQAGFVNMKDEAAGKCVADLCKNNPCGDKRCFFTPGDATYKCGCPEGSKEVEGKCVETKLRRTLKLDAWVGKLQVVWCPKGEFIHIVKAVWSGFVAKCRGELDRVKEVRGRCENRQECKFVPALQRNVGWNLEMGDQCPGIRQGLRGEAECWNPCIGAKCGEGTCKAEAWDKHSCVCNDGFAFENGKCVVSKLKRTIILGATDKGQQAIGCQRNERIHVVEATWTAFRGGCDKIEDRTKEIRKRCENRLWCRYIPSGDKEDELHVSLGDPCPGMEMVVRGKAECWNPCVGEDCGVATCLALEWNKHECVCAGGGKFENGKCIETKLKRKITLKALENITQNVWCPRGQLIHIAEAIWSGFGNGCDSLTDRKKEIQVRCDNRQSCLYTPHKTRDDEPFVRLGKQCPDKQQTLKGIAECWDPCFGESCGQARCEPETWQKHKCICPNGFEYKDGKCVESKLKRMIALGALENTTQNIECLAGQRIHIREAIWSGFQRGCDTRHDRRTEVMSRCENKERCRFVPHWERDDGLYLNLREHCPAVSQRLMGAAECWDPCFGENCGEAVCKPLTWDSHDCACKHGFQMRDGKCVESKHRSTDDYTTYEWKTQQISCQVGEVIRVAEALWGDTVDGCEGGLDVTHMLRHTCDNKDHCSYIPSRLLAYGMYLPLGDPCPGRKKSLRVTAGCWKPCFGEDCGKAKCTAVTWNSHKCMCQRGFQYQNGACVESKHRHTMSVHTLESNEERLRCRRGEVLHITEAVWSDGLDRCGSKGNGLSVIRHRCENNQSCRYIPTVALSNGLNVPLGDPCPARRKGLRVTAECWEPCEGEDCGDARCIPVTWQSHKCVCDPGFQFQKGTCLESGHRTTNNFKALELTPRALACPKGELLHIIEAWWSDGWDACGNKADGLEKLRSRCENKQACSFIPTSNLDNGKNLAFGEPCKGKRKGLQGKAECWDPCFAKSCGKGTCTPLTWETFKCSCDDGFINTKNEADGECVADLCKGNPCGSGTCSFVGGDETFQCACAEGFQFDGQKKTCIKSKRAKTLKVIAPGGELATVTCPGEALIHIADAWWTSKIMGDCRSKINRLFVFRKRCNNKTKCKFIPHRARENGLYMKLGMVCPRYPRAAHLTAECWNACVGEDCGAGKCKPVTWNSYKCNCDEGHMNANATSNSKCVEHPCNKKPCGVGKCELAEGNKSYKCTCPNGHRFEEGTCKAYDTCTDVPPPCPVGATCSDGMGKIPKCACPDFSKVHGKKCVAEDSCATNNGGCPSDAKCTDGVGKTPKCECKEFFVYKNSKCMAVDQCLISNGGCGSTAKCSDGVGKAPTCICPDFYELEGGNCVDIDECANDNGGCDANATCTNNDGAEPTCQCKEKYHGDGKTCSRPGSFLFPDNGTVKVTAVDVKGVVGLHLGKCLRVNVDAGTGGVTATHKDQHQESNFALRRLEGAELSFLIHRDQDHMEIYVYARQPKDSKTVQPRIFRLRWDATCRVDDISLEGHSKSESEPRFFRTSNIISDVAEVAP